MSIFWKIYSIVFAISGLGAPAALLSSPPTVFDYVDLVTSITVVVGLIGFAFRLRIGAETFWKAAVVILFVWEVLYNVIIVKILGLGQRGIEADVAMWVLGLAMIALAYVGLFLYAYRRHEFWQTARA